MNIFNQNLAFLNFTTDNMAESLEFLIVGMLGIFAVIGVIILVTAAVNAIFSGKGKKN